MEKQILAVYVRLSLEDGDFAAGDVKTESDSICHQREMITRYIKENRLALQMQIREFADDGYSGTNFERPAVKEMLALAQSGKIECIIVKDISRFGRNYLEVEDYLEQIFPSLGVRFIAINDGYDSADYTGTTGGMETALRSLLYDLYSKDLSQKIRASLLVRRKRGDFIGSKAPFGYQFSGQKRNLAVDNTAAQYVKKIFKLACGGYGTGEIARILNTEKIPTPRCYQNKTQPQQISNQKGLWDSRSVRRILQNQIYLGIAVNGKSRVEKIGSRHFQPVPEEDWICVPDRHEALITGEEFCTASQALKNRGHQKGKRHARKKESGTFAHACTQTQTEMYALPEHTDAKKRQKECLILERKRDSLKIEKQYLYEQWKIGRLERKTYFSRLGQLRADERSICGRIQEIWEER